MAPRKKPSAVPRLNAEWHRAHLMPKNPTTEERLTWHQAHEAHCGCRPMPEGLRALLVSRRPRKPRATAAARRARGA